MPYKTYQLGDAERTAKLSLHYDEADAVNKRLQQRMDLLANYLILTKDMSARISSDANYLTVEVDWNLGDYYLQLRGRNGISQDLSCRLLPEGFAVTIGKEKYMLKKKNQEMR